MSTLDVVGRHPDAYRVFALVAGQNDELLSRQIAEHRPRYVAVATDIVRANLCKRLEQAGLPRSEWPQISFGPGAYVEAATAAEADCVISAIVGVAGLEATYEAVLQGKRIGLANKEVLVASGKLVIELKEK